MAEIEFDKINSTILLNFLSFLKDMIPNGKVEGNEYVALNPCRVDNHLGSFKVNLKSGLWGDFATGDKGGDPISLVAYIKGVSQLEAAKELAEKFSIGHRTTKDNNMRNNKAHSNKNKDLESVPIIPVPEDAPGPPAAHPVYGKYLDRWAYKDIDGKLMGYVCRFDTGENQKQICPLTYRRDEKGNCKWHWKSFDKPRPLYGLNLLKKYPDSQVLIVEGEKCAFAGQKILPFPFISWPNGTNSVKNTDWKPLENRKVILWYDNDEPGKKAMQDVYNQIKDIAAEIRFVKVPKNKPDKWDIADAIEEGWNQEKIINFIKSNLVKPDNTKTTETLGVVFWDTKKSNDGNETISKISQSKLIAFLESYGFCKMYIKNTNQSIFIRIEENVVKKVSPEIMKDFVLDSIKKLPAKLQNNDKFSFFSTEVLELITRGANCYFGRDKMECLQVAQPEFHSDDEKTAYFYFQNGYVKVTKDGKELHSFSALKGVIWENQIIRRNYTQMDESEVGEFETLLLNICANDKKRFLELRTVIGYLLHRYKNKSLAKAIIFVDEKISDNPEGRTGKSLCAIAIGQIRNAVIIDGREFKFGTQFSFQMVNLDTNLIVFDDANKKFPFEKMFHMVTAGLEVEQKNKDRFKIDFEDSPKFLITTNYVVEGEGGSAEARKAEYEFSPHYSLDFTPKDEFKRNLFDDWDEEEWNRFDNFMIECARLYLEQGLLESPKINLNKRKLLQETSEEFIEFMDETFKQEDKIITDSSDKSFIKKDLYNNFCDQYEDFSKGNLTQHKFTKWLKLYAKYNGLETKDVKERLDGKPKNVIIFTKKCKESVPNVPVCSTKKD